MLLLMAAVVLLSSSCQCGASERARDKLLSTREASRRKGGGEGLGKGSEGRDLGGVEHLGRAKVGEHACRSAVAALAPPHHDVLGLEVAVHDAQRVEVRERAAQLPPDALQARQPRKRVTAAGLVRRLVKVRSQARVEKREHEAEQARATLMAGRRVEALDQLHHRGVGLLAEDLHDLELAAAAVRIPRDELDRDVLAALVVLAAPPGLEHGAKSASPEELADRVGRAAGRPAGLSHRWWRRRGTSTLGGRWRECVGLEVGEAHDFSAVPRGRQTDRHREKGKFSMISHLTG